MWIKVAALLALVLLLWSIFRLAMGLRWAKVSREGARREEEARGRHIVAELPTADGTLGFFAEDHAGFYWPAGEAAKPAVRGARLLLNGGIIASMARAGTALPEPEVPEPFEGRERWDVVLFLAGGGRATVHCGTVREGVSREIATRVFDAVRGAVEGGADRPVRMRAAGGSP
ncbi:MAG TPA: hypothetical protein VMR21_17520 [Vicinamibacteria bacterium]|nr:hypothetical protein [Vicinamibacteria bacterium]